MHGAKHAVHNVYKGLAEQFIPVLTNSAFREKGVLSPEEFVAAGAHGVRFLFNNSLGRDKSF